MLTGLSQIERRRARWRKWYYRNQEYNIARSLAWNKNNRAKKKLSDDKYKEGHREKVRLIAREWHKGRTMQSRLTKTISQLKRRVLKNNAEGSFCKCDIKFLFQRQFGCCAYCLEPIEYGKFHIDHIIPLCKGGSNWRQNLALTCPTCNLEKGAKLGYIPSWVFPV